MLDRFNLSFGSDFFVLLALSFLVLPPQWVIGWIAAAAIHELSHLLMLQLLEIRILSIRLCGFGATIKSESMSPAQELLCALAGPVGGVTTVLLLRINPYIAFCGMVQSIYNLLPVFPLDGGRVLKCLVHHLYNGPQVERIVNIVSMLTICILVIAGIYISGRYRLGFIPILFPAFPAIFTAVKNSLQRDKNNCTMALYFCK